MAIYTGTDAGEEILGGVEDDLLQGLGGDDLLDGGEGVDRLEGGLGDDRYIVGETRREGEFGWDYLEDETVEELDAGIDTAVWMGIGGYRLAANIENGVAGTRFGGVILGNELGNVITGWTGSDGNWLDGGGGDDTLTGGDWGDNLKGGDGADLLVGYGGDIALGGSLDGDTLDGGAGADIMMGGDGYDSYWADDLGDVIVELAVPAGADDTETYYYSYDSVYWTGAGAYVLPADVEMMHLRGGATEGLGNAQDNVLFSDYGGYDENWEPIGDADVTLDGAGGDDFVFGGSGADQLFGGEGTDQLSGLDGADTLHGGDGDDLINGESDQLFSASNDTLFGDAGDDRLEGGNGDDVLDGGDGGDVLIGSWGNDTLTGGAGVDRFTFGQDADVATDFTDGEDLILGDIASVTIAQDGADTLITYQGEFEWEHGTLRLLGVDAATITADDFVSYLQGSEYDDDLLGDDGDDYVSGGEGDDVVDVGGGDDGGDGGAGDDLIVGGRGLDELRGGTGDDLIDGGAGGDWMSGGAGNDRFVVNHVGDQVVDTGGGVDTIESAVSVRLGRGIENLVLGDSASRFAQAAFADAAKPAVLTGRGNDLANRIAGSSNGDRLFGADGDDRLSGGAGDDRLEGGAGRDRIKGGAGADLFVVADRQGADTILDFHDAQGDRILIRSATAHAFADLTIDANGEGDAVVAWRGGSLTLAGVDAAALDARDFRFAAIEAFAPAEPQVGSISMPAFHFAADGLPMA
jgi:Ca2+-binding RTX toxin-like protein